MNRYEGHEQIKMTLKCQQCFASADPYRESWSKMKWRKRVIVYSYPTLTGWQFNCINDYHDTDPEGKRKICYFYGSFRTSKKVKITT